MSTNNNTNTIEVNTTSDLLALCTKYGPIVRDQVARIGSVDNRDDLTARGFLAVLENEGKGEVEIIKAIRSINGGDSVMAMPFSRMGSTNNDMDEVAFDDDAIDDTNAAECVTLEDAMIEMLDSMNDPIQNKLADASFEMSEEIDQAIRDAIAAGDSARVLMLNAAWETYLSEVGLPDDDKVEKPLFAFATEGDIVTQDIKWCEEHGKDERKAMLIEMRANRGKGDYAEENEAASEYTEQRSDVMMEMGGSRANGTKTTTSLVSSWQDESFNYIRDFDMRRIAPSMFAEFAAEFSTFKDVTEKREAFEKAHIAIGAAMVAVSEVWDTEMFSGIVKTVWHNALPVDDGERAELIKKLALTIAKKNDVDYEDVVELLASIVIDDVDEGDALWIDEAEAQEALGESTFVSRILFSDNEWVDAAPEMVWPGFGGTTAKLIDSITSDSAKPSETAAFKQAFADAMAYGLSYKTAMDNAWSAYRGATMSVEANKVYRLRYEAEVAKIAKGSDRETLRLGYMAARTTAMRVARCVNGVTQKHAGSIVGMTATGLKVNGKGATEFIAWDKAIAMSNRLFLDATKVESFVTTAKNLGGQARTFAIAFESANKQRAAVWA